MNILIFLSVGLVTIQHASTKDYLFRPVSPEYNQKVQRICANPQFSSSENEPRHKIMYGHTSIKGKYPWAVALVFTNSYTKKLSSYCGGTIISSRHIITARHCIENIPATIQLNVGGVCYAKGDNCDEVDMVEAEIEFAAYQPPVSPHEQERNTTIYIYNMNHDMAIIQLKEDLEHHLSGENITDLTKPACLPHQNMKMPDLQHVYGWGKTENSAFSSHLMEVELRSLDLENDPLVHDPMFTDPNVNYTLMCQERRLYCMHSNEGSDKKDGGAGDSGSGIVSKIGPLAYLFGSTIAGSTTGFALNIATRTQEFTYLLCHHTGICTEKEWVGKTDPSKIHIKYTAFFDGTTKEKVIKD